jgi:RNA polymerase sigma-70 factor (ECF subfamily)
MEGVGLTSDEAAFEELVRTHQQLVFGFACKLLANAVEAEEAAQEVFLRAHKGLGAFRGEAKLSTWLYRITSNVCLSRLRSPKRRAPLLGEDTLLRLASRDADPAAELDRHELEVALNRAIGELSEDRRVVLVLRDLEGLSYDEIAEVLELESGTVRSRLHRARMEVKEKLEKFYHDV